MMNITTYQYSKNNRLSTIVVNGELTEIIRPDENLTLVTNEQLSSMETASVQIISDGATTSYTEVNGVVQEITKEDGSTTNIETNTAGQVTRSSLSKNGDMGSSYSYEYDIDGNLLTKTNDLSGKKEVSKFVDNLQVSHKDFDGIITEWEYDERGNLVKEYKGVKDNMILQKEYRYDNNGFVIEEGQLGIFKKIEYDTFGNVIKQTVGDDVLNETETISYIRDPAGNILNKTEGENIRPISFNYDAMGRITEVDEARGKSTYSYSASTHEVVLTDPLAGIHTLGTDSNANLVLLADPEGKKWETGYLNKDQVAWKKRPDGSMITYDYDKSGKYVREVLSSDVNQRKYCENKNLLWAKNSLVHLTNIYSNLGHHTGNRVAYDGQYPIDITISNYDSGKRKSVSSSSTKLKEVLPTAAENSIEEYTTSKIGSQLNYYYNDQGQLSKIKCGSFSIEYLFDDSGRLITINRGNNVSTDIEYLSTGKPKKITDLKEGLILDEKTFSFDTGGNLVSIASSQSTDLFEYDKNDQITKAHIDNTILTFDYDEKGNRKTIQSVEIEYSDKRVLYLSDHLWSYSYDANGYLIEKKSNSAPEQYSQYEYSDLSQLISYKKWDGASSPLITAEYFYDPVGRRTGKKVIYRDEPLKNRTSWWIYDGENILLEMDENFTLRRQYIHGANTDDVLGFKESGNTYYYIKNIQGSIEKIIDHLGNEVKTYSYDPFGVILSQQGSPDLLNPYCFTGREWDEESETYYFRNRQYDPFTGRFLQPDTYPGNLDDPISIYNKYIYARNNPFKYHDPYGLFWFQLLALLVIVIVDMVILLTAIGAISGIISGIVYMSNGKSFWQGFNYGFKRSVSFVSSIPGYIVGGILGAIGYVVGGVIGLIFDEGNWAAGAKEGWEVGFGFGYQVSTWVGNVVIQLVDNMMPDEFKHGAYDTRLAGFSAYCSSIVYLLTKEKIQSRLPQGFTVDLLSDTKHMMFEDNGEYTDTQCFTAYNDNNIVIAFRGSETPSFSEIDSWGATFYDWAMTDIVSGLFMVNHPDAPLDWGYQPQIGYGWWDAYESVREEIKNSIANIDSIQVNNVNVTRKILICGHSLGATLATLCALDISRSLHREVTNYTIGSPRVGNIAFTDFYQSHVIDSHRMVNGWDPVPGISFNSLGYYHVDKLKSLDGDSHGTGDYLNNIIEDEREGKGLGWDEYYKLSTHVFDFVDKDNHIECIKKITGDDAENFITINDKLPKNPVKF